MAGTKKKVYTDKLEFEKANQAYMDSLNLFNTQNQFNADYLANFKNTPIPPTTDINVLEELKKIATTKNAKATKDAAEDLIKNGWKKSKANVKILKPTDNLYKGKAKRVGGLKIESGHFIPNSQANTWSPLDLLNNDTKDYEHGLTVSDGFTVNDNIIKDEASYSRYREDGLIQNHDVITYSYPHKNIYNNKIKPVGILKYHQEVPDPTWSGQGSFNPKDSDYNDATSVNVDLQYYKKPTDQPIFQQPVNTNKSISKSNRKPTLTKIPISEISQQEINIKPEQILKKVPIKDFKQSNYEEIQKYTAAKALKLQGKPSGYVNEGNKTGRKEIKAEGGWLDRLPFKKADGGLIEEPPTTQILPKDSTQYNNAYNSPLNQGRVGFTTEKDYLNNWFSSQRFKDKIGTADPNNISNQAVNKVKTSKLFYNPDDTKGSIENYVDMHTNTSKRDKKELLKHKAVGKSYKDSNDAIITKVEGQNNPNSISIHELTHLTGLDELNRSKFKGTLYQDKYGNTVPFNRGEAYPSLMQFRYDNNFKPDQVITPEDMKNIRDKGYRNILDDKYTDDEILNYLNTVADNSTSNPNQMANGGMIKRADGSYSQRGLWDNIRANKGSGKAPTKQMLEQEKKIKSKHANGGWLDGLDNKIKFKDGGTTSNKLELPIIPKSQQEAQALLENKEYQKQKWRNSLTPYNPNRKLASGKVEESISPLDLIGIGEIKGAINLSKEIYQGNKIRKMMSPIKDVLNKPKFNVPEYLEPNISKITRPNIDKEEHIMESFTGRGRGYDKRTKLYNKETAPNYEQLEQMRKTGKYANGGWLDKKITG